MVCLGRKPGQAVEHVLGQEARDGEQDTEHRDDDDDRGADGDELHSA